MTLTQEQWFEKFKSWVPTWFLESPQYQDAILWGYAAVFSNLENNSDIQISEGFISSAEDVFLDLHGFERNYNRIPDETDDLYRRRIINLFNQGNPIAIQEAVQRLLNNGAAMLIEDETTRMMANRGLFATRGAVFTSVHYRTFQIVIDKQKSIPGVTASRGYFATRGSFIGLQNNASLIFKLITETVNRLKDGGVLYRIVERTS